MELPAPPSGYTIVEELDAHRGELTAPMAEAVHEESGERVALLWLRRDEELESMQRVAQLGEPSLAPIFDRSHGSNEGGHGRPSSSPAFVAWSFEGGETLRRRLRRGPLEALPTVHIARGIADGLRALHDAGIPHGGLRPAVILLGRRDEVRLLAAGSGQAFPDLPPDGPDPGTSAVAYYSPERLRSEDGSGSVADDLWALGVVLYEMLEGDLPFAGPSARTMRQAILSAEPMPLAAVPGVLPYQLERLLDWTLARDPAQRYASASALLDELDAVEALLMPRPRSASAAGTVARPQHDHGPLHEALSWLGSHRERLASAPEPALWRLFLAPGLVLLALVLALLAWCVHAG